MVVLRSLTKFYAMPGLRIGYLLGASKVVGRLKDRQPPWSVNSLAQEVSCAVLQDEAYAKKSRIFMEKERSSFRAWASLLVWSASLLISREFCPDRPSCLDECRRGD